MQEAQNLLRAAWNPGCRAVTFGREEERSGSGPQRHRGRSAVVILYVAPSIDELKAHGEVAGQRLHVVAIDQARDLDIADRLGRGCCILRP